MSGLKNYKATNFKLIIIIVAVFPVSFFTGNIFLYQNESAM